MATTFDPPEHREQRDVLVVRLQGDEDHELLARAIEGLVTSPDPVVLDASDLVLTDPEVVQLLGAAVDTGAPVVCRRLSGRRVLRKRAAGLRLFASVDQAVAALGAVVPHEGAEGWQGTELE